MNEPNVRNVNEQNLQRIKEHLQSKDAQERIEKRMEDARSKATVTISRAARLFGFSENQLRDWERRFGLLKTDRSSQEGKNTTGHRQYSPAELDKLAIIKELTDKGGFAPADIPQDIDKLWKSISRGQQPRVLKADVKDTEHLPIDQRLERVDQEVFWRYFVSQALRLSIMLICEDIPDTIGGLVLPLQAGITSTIVKSPNDLLKLGDCLIGWLGRNGSFYTFLDQAPSFEFPSDFRVQPVIVTGEGAVEEEIPQDNTVIIVQRKAKPLNLSSSLGETIRCLLKPIYNNVDEWRPCFDYGIRDWVYQATDFTSSPGASDNVLNDLADMIISLGGKTLDGRDRWGFCCLLLPRDPLLPLQKHSLVVRAQSKRAPHSVAITTVSPDDPGLSLSAHQSGHIIYRPDTTVKDFMFAHPKNETSTRSAIAIPIAGEDGLSIGVLYIASNETNAFPEDAWRVLRIMSKMVEELLMTYHARRQATGKLSDLIVNPSVVDTSFEDFLSENEFLQDLEELLTTIKEDLEEWQEPVRKEEVPLTERKARFREGQLSGDVVSFIAIDIDNQSSLANKYGDRITRNLSQAVGLRIKGQLSPFEKYASSQPYHMFADRFYLLLKGVPLDEAQIKAEQLRQALKGSYRIYGRRISSERSILPENMLELIDVTVRVGVTSYSYAKLRELLQRQLAIISVVKVRELITKELEEALNVGLREGGNVVISWDPGSWGFTVWSPLNKTT